MLQAAAPSPFLVHCMAMTTNPVHIATQWLSAFNDALKTFDVNALTRLFLSDGWLRDFLVFTWDIRSLAGRQKIGAYLADALSMSAITGVELDHSIDLSPRALPIPLMQGVESVELAFTFNCKHGHGRGYARLVRDGAGEFGAITLFTELVNLHGYEELPTLPLRDDVTGQPGRDIHREFQDYVKNIEEKPYVLIGQWGYTLLPCALIEFIVCQWEAARQGYLWLRDSSR